MLKKEPSMYTLLKNLSIIVWLIVAVVYFGNTDKPLGDIKKSIKSTKSVDLTRGTYDHL